MGSALYDYTMLFASSRKEKKKRSQGAIRNANLPANIVSKINIFEARMQQGDYDYAYELGMLYLDASEVGYDPDKGRYYLEIGAKNKHFNCNYALALFYKGYWSFQHYDPYKSWLYYASCTDCKNADPKYMQEAIRAYKNDFFVEHLRKEIKVAFKVDVPIK